MCGLAGWYGLALPERAKQEELLRLLMRKAQARGTDSFGLAYKRGGQTRVQRGLGPVSQWIARKPAQLKEVANSRIVIGHTRAASQGEVVLRNAHPFRVGNWIGAHNGMIRNAAALNQEATYAPRGETDSEEALCWLVGQGLSPEAFTHLEGWYAFTAIDTDTSDVLIAVDSRTPFAIAQVGSAFIWHSVAVALEASLRAVGIDAPVTEIKSSLIRIPSGKIEELKGALPVRMGSHSRIVAGQDAWPDDDEDDDLPLFGGKHE